MNQTAIAPAPETPAPTTWHVYQVTESECWIGQSIDDVIRSYCEVMGCSEADCHQYELLDRSKVRELTDAELDRRIFVDYYADRNDPTRKRSFRAELERVLRVEKPEFPLMFSTTEI